MIEDDETLLQAWADKAGIDLRSAGRLYDEIDKATNGNDFANLPAMGHAVTLVGLIGFLPTLYMLKVAALIAEGNRMEGDNRIEPPDE